MNKHKNQRELQNLLVKANTNTSPAGAHTFSGSLYWTRCLELPCNVQVPGKQSRVSDASEAQTALLGAGGARSTCLDDLSRSARVGTILVLISIAKGRLKDKDLEGANKQTSQLTPKPNKKPLQKYQENPKVITLFACSIRQQKSPTGYRNYK